MNLRAPLALVSLLATLSAQGGDLAAVADAVAKAEQTDGLGVDDVEALLARLDALDAACRDPEAVNPRWRSAVLAHRLSCRQTGHSRRDAGRNPTAKPNDRCVHSPWHIRQGMFRWLSVQVVADESSCSA